MVVVSLIVLSSFNFDSSARGSIAEVLNADWIAARAHYSTFHWNLVVDFIGVGS